MQRGFLVFVSQMSAVNYTSYVVNCTPDDIGEILPRVKFYFQNKFFTKKTNSEKKFFLTNNDLPKGNFHSREKLKFDFHLMPQNVKNNFVFSLIY